MKITIGELKRIIREEAGEREEVDMSKITSGFDPLKDNPYDYNSALYAARETGARHERLIGMLSHFDQGRRMIPDEREKVDMSKLPRGFNPLVDNPVDYNSTLYSAREEKKAKGNSARLKSLMDKLKHFKQERRMK